MPLLSSQTLRNLHDVVSRASTTLWHCQFDVLRGILNGARLTLQAILCMYSQRFPSSLICDVLENTCEALTSRLQPFQTRSVHHSQIAWWCSLCVPPRQDRSETSQAHSMDTAECVRACWAVAALRAIVDSLVHHSRDAWVQELNMCRLIGLMIGAAAQEGRR